MYFVLELSYEIAHRLIPLFALSAYGDKQDEKIQRTRRVRNSVQSDWANDTQRGPGGKRCAERSVYLLSDNVAITREWRHVHKALSTP